VSPLEQGVCAFYRFEKANYMPCESRKNGMTPESPSVKTLRNRLSASSFPAAQFFGRNGLSSDQNLTLSSHSDGYPTDAAGAALTFGHDVLKIAALSTFNQRQICIFRSRQDCLFLCFQKDRCCR
jgi:hypothetical protein